MSQLNLKMLVTHALRVPAKFRVQLMFLLFAIATNFAIRACSRTEVKVLSPMPRVGVFTTRSNAASSSRFAIKRK